MSLDERFDKIIKNKINEAEFPFDESNWQKASAMIDAERGVSGLGKTSKLFLLFGSIFFVIATVTFLSLTMGNSNKTVAVTNENKNVVSLDNSQNNTSENLNTSLPVTSNSPETNATENINTNSNASTNNNSNNNSNTNILAAALVKNPKKENTISVSGSKPAINKSKSSYMNASIESNNVNATAENKAIETAVSSNKAGLSRAERKALKKKEAERQKKFQEELDRSFKAINSKEGISNDKVALAQETYDHLEMRSSVLQLWNKEETLKNTPCDFIRVYEEDYYKKSRRTRHYLNVEAGATYLLGWETAKGKDAKGINAFGGINYGFYLSRKTSMSVGLQAYNVSNIKQSFYSKANVSYDFGQNGEYTNITANSLYYISIPVKAYYSVSRKGKIGLGVNTGFLVNGKNTVETYKQSDGVKSNVVLTNNTGAYEGLSKTNFLVSALYNHSLTRRVKLNAEAIFGLSDTYNNTISKSATNQNNVGFRLSLQYTLFSK